MTKFISPNKSYDSSYISFGLPDQDSRFTTKIEDTQSEQAEKKSPLAMAMELPKTLFKTVGEYQHCLFTV